MKKCAEAITNWLISREAIGEEDRDLYVYAVYSILLSTSPLLLALMYGILLGYVWQSVLIITPFVFVRKFCGGYHTNRAGTCLVSSSLLLLSCILLSSHITFGWKLGFITVLAAISLAYFSPIDNKNRVLSQEECSYCKRKTIMIVLVFLAINILFLWNQLYTYAVCISVGIILSAGLQMPCVINNLLHKMTK